jgi:hypothetical protein
MVRDDFGLLFVAIGVIVIFVVIGRSWQRMLH